MTTEDTAAVQRAALSDEEQEQLAYYVVLRELEAAGDQTTILIGPRTLFDLIAMVQLALRNPSMPASISTRMTQLVHQLATPYAGTLGAEIIARGFNPDYDFAGPAPEGATFDEWIAAEYAGHGEPQSGAYTEDDMRMAYNTGRAIAAGLSQPAP